MTDFNFGEFLTLATIHFLAVLAPGPDFAVTVRQSVLFGRKIGVITALGIGAGISVHVVYTLLGAGALMHSSPWILRVAEVLGSAYLLYLGLTFIRTAGKSMANVDLYNVGVAPTPNAKKSFWMGFTTNATNPKATLFFLAIFTTIVSASTPLGYQIFYGVWMCVVNALWFIVVSLIFTTKRIREWFLRYSKWFERLMGVLLIIFSVRLLWEVVKGFF